MFFRRSQKNGFKVIVKLTVHAGQLEFKFKIGNCTKTTQDGFSPLLARKVNQQPVKTVYLRIGDRSKCLAGKFNSFGQIKKRLFAATPRSHTQDNPVEKSTGPAHQVGMTIGDGIKGTGVDCNKCHARILA